MGELLSFVLLVVDCLAYLEMIIFLRNININKILYSQIIE